MMDIYSKLFNIQQELKAPKDLFNSFGKYSYRSCENILEALKPLLQKNGLVVMLSDEVKEIGGRVYVEATATLVDTDTGKAIATTALAREEDAKKGMDASQVTGASSSYARKYALNGLFAIDDNKDSDATNKGENTPNNSGKSKQHNNTPQAENSEKTAGKAGNSELYKRAEDYIRTEGEVNYSVCARCNGFIYDQRRKDGSVMSVKDYVASCLKVYGEPVCKSCRKNEGKNS